jgi:hypothetical protein
MGWLLDEVKNEMTGRNIALPGAPGTNVLSQRERES